MENYNWRKALNEEMANHGESWGDVESHTLTDEQLDRCFDDGYGIEEGDAFTLWTKNRVYFPAVYDGSEWVASVARHPDGKATAHVGGG